MKLDYLEKKSITQGGGDVECFQEPLSLAEMENLSHQIFAQNTENKIAWAVQLYRNWWFQRCAKVDCDSRVKWASIDNLKQVSRANLCFALSAFIGEIKKDGSEFPGPSLYQIIICIQFHVEKNGLKLKLLDHPDFVSLRFTLDNLMKECARAGLGRKQSADIISVDDEEKMWREGMLGDDKPEQLLHTVMYLLGLNLALHGGDEHRKLRAPGHNSQLEILKDSEGKKFIKFTEDVVSKTNQGGLSIKVSQPKVLTVYGCENPFRNVVRILEKYLSLLPVPTKCAALYRYPATGRSFTCRTWFSDRPLGVNSIKKIVKNLAEKAGLKGHFSNHSLHATCATRLFEAGVDKQLIKNVTGHRSDSVRDYKRTNQKLLSEAQKMVSCVGEGGKEGSVPDKVAEKRSVPKEFDIDEYELSKEKIQRFVNSDCSGNPSHKHQFCTSNSHECTELCEVMKKIDTISEMHKVKKLKLSLKYRCGKKE